MRFLARIALLLCLCITLFTARAQYVAIPDTNFGKWLNNNGYSSCLTGNSTTGWQLDTLCSTVLSATNMSCPAQGIHDLSGIVYFKHLTSLYYGSNAPAIIPTLPATLSTFDCSQNQLTSLPALPPALTNLNCSENRLTSLPALPATLTTLNADNNQLTSLPSLPALLATLYCDFNQLTSLPALPASLTWLQCRANQLTTLPTLPPVLSTLFCRDNALDSLPTLPHSLKYLNCVNCQLGSLPVMPDSMTTLFCDTNLLSYISALPHLLTTLSCTDNPSLSCLPHMYENALSTFLISGTNIQCMPNVFTAGYYDVRPDSLQLCGPAGSCDFYYNIAGSIHNDTSANCTLDSLHPGSIIENIKVQLIRNGQVEQQFYTYNGGQYSFVADTLTGYTVTIDTSGLPLTVACPAVGSHYVPLTPADSVVTGVNFGMTCSSPDYAVLYMNASGFSPADTAIVNITAGNLANLGYHADCTSPSSGRVVTIYSGPVQYVGPAPGARSPTSVSGDSLTYTISDMNSLTYGSLDILLSTDSSAVVGDLACIITIISPSIPDGTPADNVLAKCFVVLNSHDPNRKEVYPLDTFQRGDWLSYTVHFQNTGTDTAFNVVVRDTLSPYLDASTFQYLGSSGDPLIQLFGNDAVFTFAHIDLPDSAASPQLSQGWIQYRVRTKAQLPGNTHINNTASIYFDLNPAIVTNTTINVLAVNCQDTTMTLTHAICQGDTFVFGSMHLTTQGTYIDTLARIGGCDSVIRLTLTVHPIAYDTISRAICQGDSFVFAGVTHRSGGYYSDTLQSSVTCDSIVVLNLTINPILYDTISHAICQGDSFVFAGVTHHSGGYYSDTLQSSMSCDSVVVLNLTVNPLPVVSFTWDSLQQEHYVFAYSSSQAGWCPLFFSPIIPLVGGLPSGGVYSGNLVTNDTLDLTHFSMAVNNVDTIYYTYTDGNFCSVTLEDFIAPTSCDGIQTIPNANLIQLHPNPNRGSFTLSTSGSIGSTYTISDMLGHIIEQKIITSDSQSVDMPEAGEGVYTLVVKGTQPIRFVIVR